MRSAAAARAGRLPLQLIAALAAVTLIASAGCAHRSEPVGDRASDATSQSPPPSPQPPDKKTTGSLAPNIERALAHLEAQPALAPSALLVVDPLRRWYALDVFPDLMERYRRALRRGNDPSVARDPQAAYLRVMRRIIYPMKINTGGLKRWEDFAPQMLEKGGINPITIPALYCDQVPYPETYESILEAGLRAGGYELTHVGLALRWIDENGCSSPMDASFESTVASAIGEIPDPTDGVKDLEIEATAFLMYMRRRDLVPAGMVDAIASVQRPDGGWSLDSSDESLDSAWHPTTLGLWVLLGQHRPDVEMSPMIVPDEASEPQKLEGGGA
jgi:hypothetical protein